MRALKKVLSGLFIEEPPARRGARDARAYAIGDVHGRLDLLDEMLALIAADNAGRPAKKTYLINLGDLIDRGPESRGVIERLMAKPIAAMQPVNLMGNHEEVMLRVLDGEQGILFNWLKFGGAECLESYGLNPFSLGQLREEEALQLIRETVPAAHREFLAGFADTFSFGDYLFVHAGIRPGVPIEDQRPRDLRWIREPFLADTSGSGQIVVHGHTIVDGVQEKPARIAIDTGAYKSGVLTAIAIEDDERWYLSATRRD